MDKSHCFGKTAEDIWKILVSDQKYGCLTRYLWIGFCIQPQGSLPQLKKFVTKVVNAKGGHSECAPICVFALHSCLACTKGEDGVQDITKLLADCQVYEFVAAI